jgi:hypothetical protein
LNSNNLDAPALEIDKRIVMAKGNNSQKKEVKKPKKEKPKQTATRNTRA